jgi:hypothetical protein
MNRILTACVIYFVIMAVVLVLKPSRTYDSQSHKYREMGTSEHSTLMPMWLVTGIVGVVSYTVATVVSHWSHTPTTSSGVFESMPHHTADSNSDVHPIASVFGHDTIAPLSTPPLPNTHKVPPSFTPGHSAHTPPSVFYNHAGSPEVQSTHPSTSSISVGAYQTHTSHPPNVLPNASRRATMAGGGGRRPARGQPATKMTPTQQASQRGGGGHRGSGRGCGVDTRFAHHADKFRRSHAVLESRVWKRVMT